MSEASTDIGDSYTTSTFDGHVLCLEGVSFCACGCFCERNSKAVGVVEHKDHESGVLSGRICDGGHEILTTREDNHGFDTVVCVEFPFVEAIWDCFLPSFIERQGASEKTLDFKRGKAFE